jgi:uncharacterized protein YecE (DUF72 family)
MSKILIGTSGYNYVHWSDGVFYPQGLIQGKYLEYYCRFFNSVELNVSFYRLPSEKAFKGWYKRTPKNFLFAVKGSRFITHIKRLKDCKDSIRIFFKNVSNLKEKLACILWQLPPGLKKDNKRLEDFLKILKKIKIKVRHSFEFRHQSWFDKETYNLLKDYQISLCIAHSDRWPLVKEVTSNFLYLRFHGETILYGAEYSEGQLKEWAKFAKSYLNKGFDILAYFNNDAYGFAVKNALRLKELIK